MKVLPFLAAILVSGILSVSAENAPSAPSVPTPAPLTRFDLDFPGGTPVQFADAISKAMGRHLNVVIPADYADMKIIPAIRMEKITVADLFNSIELATAKTIQSRGELVPVGEMINVRIAFKPAIAEGSHAVLTDESAWAFVCNYPIPKERTKPEPPPVRNICFYFQLAPYLDNYTIEDITTAIQTGWKMLDVEPPPQLSFHKETKLLIATGPDSSIAIIPQVLNQLIKDDSPAVEKIAALQEEIAEIQEKKAPGWEKLVEDKQLKIRKIASVQRAREAIQAPDTSLSGDDPPPRRVIRPKPINVD